VSDAGSADWLLLFAQVEGERYPAPVRSTARSFGFEYRRARRLDATRRFSRVSLDASPCRPKTASMTQTRLQDGLSRVSRTDAPGHRRRNSSAGAQQCLDLTVAYTATRKQFGPQQSLRSRR